ncbi:hypothetical protein ACYSUO_25705 [Streptomyces sp. UC4497]
MTLDDDGWYTDADGNTWAPVEGEEFPEGTPTVIHDGVKLFNVDHAGATYAAAYLAAKLEGVPL